MKGKIALEYGYDLELKVLKSKFGYYLGTFKLEIGPVTRESEEYWNSYNEAQVALETNQFTQRLNP